MPSVSRTLWSVMSTPMPRALRKLMMRWISSTAIGSTPAKGSSSRMKRGCVASARAISTRRRSPPDSAGAGDVCAASRCPGRAAAVQQAGRSARGSGLPSAPSCSSEHGADVLLHRQLAEDRGFLRQVREAQARTAVDGQALDGWPSMLISPASARTRTDDHVEAGRFAGAVGPEQAHHLAAAHRQAKRPDDLAAHAVGFCRFSPRRCPAQSRGGRAGGAH